MLYGGGYMERFLRALKGVPALAGAQNTDPWGVQQASLWWEL
jgi:hypothetical protein